MHLDGELCSFQFLIGYNNIDLNNFCLANWQKKKKLWRHERKVKLGYLINFNIHIRICVRVLESVSKKRV